MAPIDNLLSRNQSRVHIVSVSKTFCQSPVQAACKQDFNSSPLFLSAYGDSIHRICFLVGFH